MLGGRGGWFVGNGTRLIFTTYFRSDLAEYEKGRREGSWKSRRGKSMQERKNGRRDLALLSRLAVAKLKSPPVNT